MSRKKTEPSSQEGEEQFASPCPPRGEAGEPDTARSDVEVLAEEIQNLPPRLREIVVSKVSGPLPPPGFLREYNEILPGMADRLVVMLEEEAAHRRAQEGKMVESSCQDQHLGLWLGFLIGVVALLVSGAVLIWGNALGGTLLGMGSLATLVGVFVYGTKQKGIPSRGEMASQRREEDE